MKRLHFVILLIITVIVSSCRNNKNQTKMTLDFNKQLQDFLDNENQRDSPIIPEVQAKFSDDYNFTSNSSFHTDAHSQFLQDPMKFTEVPTQGITEGKTAVVASDFCKLYPDEAFDFSSNIFEIDTNFNSNNNSSVTADIKENIYQTGTSIPFGKLIKIGRKMLNNTPLNQYTHEMFEFQYNWNWFYETEYDGKRGWVFGADLYGVNDTIEHNRISAELYNSDGKFQEFYPNTGYIPLEASVTTCLENNRLALQKTLPPDYISTDDMIDKYSQLTWRAKGIPIFITTDLAAHSQHLIFDRIIQHTEEFYFLPRLVAFTDLFIEAIQKRNDVPENIKNKALQYFEVPKMIMETGAERIEPENWYEPVEYKEKTEEETNQILAKYSEEAVADYKKIMEASDFTEESIFGDKEDFSQYRPRGHYTKNKLLETYFRAQMWYGHLNFVFALPKKDTDEIPEEQKNAELVATFLADTVLKDKNLFSQWDELFTPISSLIGESDDLSFNEVLPLWKSQGVSDFDKWANNPANLKSFIRLCREKLNPPAISGSSVFQQYAEINEETGLPETPMGWKMFGQRFTYDSFIHDQVSPPRLMPRDIVRGLDIMKVFGSNTAEILLSKSDYPNMEGLKEKLDNLQEEFSSLDSNFWKKSYYNRVLYQIKTLATFEQGAGFYFTETPAWNIKSQLSAHGTWAELRHDTILYVKQSFAERAGDGDYEPTFRTKPLPKPVHYIEPNIPFWESSVSAVSELYNIYLIYDLLDDESEYALKKLLENYKMALEICKKEAANEPITENENAWIPTFISSLNNIVLVHNNKGYVDNHDLLKMACIADIFTNGDLGLCVETGVGFPHRIYVPLNDSQGGKRIAVGYIFSYYEFNQPMNSRMTDDEWKKIVYKVNNLPKLPDYMPFWENECLLSLSNIKEFQ